MCNTGVGLIPRVDGEVELFTEKGLYDGLFLLSDLETGTYWSHVTGEALYGPRVGKRLELENVLHSTVAQVLAEDAGARVAISDHPRAQRRPARGGTLDNLLSGFRSLSNLFRRTMGKQDTRREDMDLGLGIWSEAGARYYSMEAVEAAGRALLDTFQGRGVLVYYDPTAHALAAQFTDADSIRWEDDVLHLSTGDRIEDGVRRAADGTTLRVERPLQVFTRWYGFSLSFPETEVYVAGG